MLGLGAVTSMDRVSQLQQSLGTLATQFCDGVGIIHTEHSKYLSQKNAQDTEREINVTIRAFVDCIAVSSANIDTLISSLPKVREFSEHQSSMLLQRQVEDEAAAAQLRSALADAEKHLEEMKNALKLLSEARHGLKSNPS